MTRIYYPSWRDYNADIRYPFVDDASLLSDDGLCQITDDWLVDAAIYSPVAIGRIRITQIELDGSQAKITVADDSQDLGIATIDRLSSGSATILDANSQPVGTLVPGPRGHAALFDTVDGIYFFSLRQLELVSSCVLLNPSPSALHGFRTSDGKTVISDNLVFVGERGIQLTVGDGTEVDIAGQTETVQVMRIHAMGDPQYLTRECDDPARRPQRFIREIVFQYGDLTQICRPDATGNILLLAGASSVSESALSVIMEATGIRLVLAGKSVN